MKNFHFGRLSVFGFRKYYLLSCPLCLNFLFYASATFPHMLTRRLPSILPCILSLGLKVELGDLWNSHDLIIITFPLALLVWLIFMELHRFLVTNHCSGIRSIQLKQMYVQLEIWDRKVLFSGRMHQAMAVWMLLVLMKNNGR